MNTNEWQYDSNGRKYRKDGYIIEYAPEITTAHGGTMYMDDLEEYNKRIKEKHIQTQQQQSEKKECPFKKARNYLHTLCDRNCAFFEGDSCILANTGKKPLSDTKGRKCPFGQICCKECVMYNHGCKLIQLVKCMKHGKE